VPSGKICASIRSIASPGGPSRRVWASILGSSSSNSSRAAVRIGRGPSDRRRGLDPASGPDRHAARRDGLHGRVPGLGAARPEPDGAARPVPAADLCRRQRGQLPHVRRAVRRAVPDVPVLPDMPRILTARGRAAAAPVGAAADDHRSDRRRARRPLRQPAVHGAGARPAGDRTRMGRGNRRSPRGLPTGRRCVDDRRHRYLVLLPDGRQRDHGVGSAARAVSRRARTARSASSAGCSAWPLLATVFARHGVYSSPRAFVDGFSSAVWVAVGFSGLGVVAALLTAARPRPDLSSQRRRREPDDTGQLERQPRPAVARIVGEQKRPSPQADQQLAGLIR
jgi:hypothetical protein